MVSSRFVEVDLWSVCSHQFANVGLWQSACDGQFCHDLVLGRLFQ